MGKKLALALGVLAVVLCGCATTPKVDETALIRQSIDVFKAGMESKNVDKLMSAVSDKFTHYQWGDKKALADFVGNTFSQGDLDDAEIDATKAEIKIGDDGVATVYPVNLTAVFGSATIEFKMKKEADGVWRAVTMNIEGI